MSLTKKAQEAHLTNNYEFARTLFLLALEKERNAAEMLEPAIQVEPVRVTLFRNAAALALKCEDFKAARDLATQAMAGVPPRNLIGELREILTSTSKLVSTANTGIGVREPIKQYGFSSVLLITYLPRRSSFRVPCCSGSGTFH